MAAPKAILRGIDDKSTRQLPAETVMVSQHTPLLLIPTMRGPVEPTFIKTSDFDTYYDIRSLEENGDWFTHQSVLAKIAINTINATMVVKRIVDDTAKTASACIGVTTGNKIKVVESDHDESDTAFKPLIEFEMANPGAWGNSIGIQIYKADEKKQNVLGRALGSVVYEAVVVEEDEITKKQRVINNLYGEAATSFTFKPDSLYNNVDYFFDEIMYSSYVEEDNISRPQYFKSFTSYPSVVAALAQAGDDMWLTDVLADIVSDGTHAFRKNLAIFGRGGDDGFHDYSRSVIENRLHRVRIYEDECRMWLKSIDETNPIVDMAQYPFSTFWDSGFMRETKEEAKRLLQYRKDVWIAMAVTSANRQYADGEDMIFDYQPKLTNQETISLAMYYRSIFSGVAESIDYGTPTVRCTLIAQDGVNRNSTYRKRQTLNVDLFTKVSKYCGAADSRWKSQHAFDQDGKNLIDGWHDLSLDYLSPARTDDTWDAGLIYVQSRDTRSKFYPMYQTIYPDDTSALNSIFTMMACCWIEKCHFKAWTTVTGDSKSTNLEIAEKLDQYLNSALMNAFDGRFITTSETSFTKTDELNGFSFTTETTIYSSITKHTANYKITAHRMSDIV